MHISTASSGPVADQDATGSVTFYWTLLAICASISLHYLSYLICNALNGYRGLSLCHSLGTLLVSRYNPARYASSSSPTTGRSANIADQNRVHWGTIKMQCTCSSCTFLMLAATKSNGGNSHTSC